MTRALGFAGAVAVVVAAACGGAEQKPAEGPQDRGRAVSRAKEGGIDPSRCDFRGRNDREAVEGSGPGALTPNIRKVFAVVGTGEDARRVLVCREVDTNLDGQKDVVRTYNDKGEAMSEQADADYDGQIDTWITFAKGRVAKVQIDTNRDGQPDVTRFYVEGRVARVQRDTNYDGKPDVWEIYSEGALERMGLDLDHDGHVDRWDRDLVVQRQLEERERREEEARERESDKADGGVTDAYVSARQR